MQGACQQLACAGCATIHQHNLQIAPMLLVIMTTTYS